MAAIVVTDSRHLHAGNDILVEGRYATIKSIDGNILTVDFWEAPVIEHEYTVATWFKLAVTAVVLISIACLALWEHVSILGWCMVLAGYAASWAHAFVSAKIHQINEERR